MSILSEFLRGDQSQITAVNTARIGDQHLFHFTHQTAQVGFFFFGEIPTWVEDLEARWSEENARARVLVEPDKAILELAFPVDAPPQLVWEYMTTPGRRVSWSAGVTDVIQEAPGNRRGVGATNHCMHGKDAVVEEILDWRPYDYNTLRSTMSTPGGQVSFLQTTEFEPTSTGTVVHMRFGPPRWSRDLRIVHREVAAAGRANWLGDAALAEGSALAPPDLRHAVARVQAILELPDVAVPEPRTARMRNTPVVCVRVKLDQPDGLFPGLSAVVGIRKK